MRSALALLATLVGLAGCGSDDPETTTAPSSGPLVTYQRSGGVAGVLEELRVEPDGQTVLVTGPDRKRTTFTIAEDELDALRSELGSADLTDPQGPPGDPGCNDCFAYRIVYGDKEVTFTDLDEPTESLSAVVSHLGALVAEHSPPL